MKRLIIFLNGGNRKREREREREKAYLQKCRLIFRKKNAEQRTRKEDKTVGIATFCLLGFFRLRRKVLCNSSSWSVNDFLCAKA